MDHIYESDAVDTAPELTSLKSKGYPTNGNPSLAIPATQPGAGWFYMITEELRNALLAQGIEPDVTKLNQLAEAITKSATVDSKGLVQLTSALDLDDETLAVTAKAIKTLNDKIANFAPIDSPTFTTKCLVPEPTEPSSAVTKKYFDEHLITVSSATINDIGTPGTQGFGVGICPYTTEKLKEYGFSPMSGYADPLANNYGNYTHRLAGQFCWIPKFFIRKGNENAPTYATYGVNALEIKPAKAFASREEARAEGWELPRAFIDGGVEKDGFFYAKFASAVVTANGRTIPMSTTTATPTVNVTAVQDIDYARSVGNGFNCTSIFQVAAIRYLILCQVQYATWTDTCAWYTADGTASYPQPGNARAHMTSAPLTFAKYTHNGQPSGISDWEYIWEYNIGVTTSSTSGTTGDVTDTTGFIYVLNESVKLHDVTSGWGTETDAWGTDESLTAKLYTKRTAPLTGTANNVYLWGNGSLDCMGDITDPLFLTMPLADTMMSSSGTNLMAKSAIYLLRRRNLAYYTGGQTVTSRNYDENPLACHFRYWRVGAGSILGARLSCYVDQSTQQLCKGKRQR